MSLLSHPLLQTLSKLVEQERTPFKWLDLYAAQFIADSFQGREQSTKQASESSTVSAGTMADLFDELDSTFIHLKQADIIVLALICSHLVSQGKTHLNLAKVPPELMASVKACGYKPSFSSSQELLEGLVALDQINILRVVTSTASRSAVMPLEDEPARKQSPLVLFQTKLYLAKYWSLHQTFERWLQSRSQYIETLGDDLLAELAVSLTKVFPKEEGKTDDQVNWQAVSAAHTLINPFSVITGGPGTGKTTTAASLLFMLMHKRQQLRIRQNKTQAVNGLEADLNGKLQVRLLAPTGKAAVKLADSIRYQLKQIERRVYGSDLTSLRMSDCLPETGETVHRFLYEMGGLRDSFQRPKRFKGDDVLLKRSQPTNQNETGPLTPSSKAPLDVVIVDESSMMDLALMVELVSLLPSTTQLILLGDHYQLPAVDPGQVFTECVQRFSTQKQSQAELTSLAAITAYDESQLTEFENVYFGDADLGFQPLCALRKTYRFSGDLKAAADHIKAGELHAFKKLFRDQGEQFKPQSAVCWYDLGLAENTDYQSIVSAYSEYFNLVAKGSSLKTLAAQFERFQLLCSTLEGPLGVHFLNTYIEQHYDSSCFPNGRIMGELYHGKAVLVTRNHPNLGIYNGDIGFVIEDQQTGNLNVHFPVANHDALIVPPARIKKWQTAYAMTVHKSQGSEYQHVGVVLADYAKELLSRALLYTALTRSKESCAIWADSGALNQAFEE